MLEVSCRLSAYMHYAIRDKKQSIWIAQREGRAKNSDDRTQESLVKMFALSGGGDFLSNIRVLNLVPVAISYEYDPCDYLKAQEMQLKRDDAGYKKQKLYPHWIKKYKINTNYFVPMGLSFDNLDEFQKYYGSMTVLKKNIKKHVFPGIVKCKTSSEDILNFFVMDSSGEDKDKPFSYSIQYANCKLKNVINIKKTTSMDVFLKKLGVNQYNFNSKKHTIDFICGKCYCNFHNDDDAEYEDIWWTIKMNDKNQLTPDTVVNFDLITDWQIW